LTFCFSTIAQSLADLDQAIDDIQKRMQGFDLEYKADSSLRVLIQSYKNFKTGVKALELGYVVKIP